jgi:hypothetical protein
MPIEEKTFDALVLRVDRNEEAIDRLEVKVETKIDIRWFVGTIFVAAALVVGMFYYLIDRQDEQFATLTTQIHEVSVTLGKTNESVASATTAILNISSFLDKFDWTTK